VAQHVHWDQAPVNPARLHEAGVPFALTSHGLEKRLHFRARVRKAIEAGLPEAAALAAVTTTPAQLLGLSEQLGSIETGKIANFTVTNGDLFGEETRVLAVWVDGDHYTVRDAKKDDVEQVAGRWKVVAGKVEAPTQEWTLEVKGNEWTLRATLEDERGRVPVRRLRWDQGELIVEIGVGDKVETLRLRSAGKKELKGTWRQADGTSTDLAASRPEPSMGGER
jgi:adenine deaminase